MTEIVERARHSHPCMAVRVGDRLGGDCAQCGHLVVLHSLSRPCVACQIIAEADEARA